MTVLVLEVAVRMGVSGQSLRSTPAVHLNPVAVDGICAPESQIGLVCPLSLVIQFLCLSVCLFLGICISVVLSVCLSFYCLLS